MVLDSTSSSVWRAVDARDAPKRGLCLHSNVAVVVVDVKEALVVSLTRQTTTSAISMVTHAAPPTLRTSLHQRASTSEMMEVMHVYTGSNACSERREVTRSCRSKRFAQRRPSSLTVPIYYQIARDTFASTRLKAEQAT